MKYLHTMIRIKDVDESLKFFCEGLGLKETRRMENEKGRFTLIFLAAPGDENAEIELTYNWDGDNLGDGSRNFGHLAYRVENTRVGQQTDYDKLLFDIETDGTVSPEDAIAFGARILTEQLKPFINFDEPEPEIEEDLESVLPFSRSLLKKVDELELSVRSANCLKNDEIITLLTLENQIKKVYASALSKKLAKLKIKLR